MTSVVYPCKITIFHNIFIAKGSLHLFKQDFFEFLVCTLVNIDMIYSYTSLSWVEEFTKNDSNSRTVKICSLIDNNRTFSSKFKDARCKIFSSCDSYCSSCFRWSSEANDIKLETSQLLGNIDLSLYHTIKSYITSGLLGSRYFSKSFNRTFDEYGAYSLGFKITLFPAHIAAATWGKAV